MSDNLPGVVHDSDGKPNIHSFIIRVRLETSGTDMDHEVWHGHIIHLPGNERHDFSVISEISVFIESCLKEQE